ncbi:hypothetical protein [Thalassobacillus pellis]|uniref:hypothetical protein n=1 Tax=Thalassobacillus pellis TaxID=748008 RepID=UPI001961E913|nr:hypothetical protein [Thalassobacillus pellis]MBM7553901.1 hypothetical protein [Thalassobacillus pellis]
MTCMENQQLETFCIKTPKVYDWITRQITIPVTTFYGLDGLERLDFRCDELNEQMQSGELSATCTLSDQNGNPVESISDSISCTEVSEAGGRQNVDILLPNGDSVIFQKVMVRTSGHFIVEIEKDSTVICTSSPQPFSICEEYLLCAPAGTTLNCQVTDIECTACFVCRPDSEGNPAFQQIDVELFLCEHVQTEVVVLLEVQAQLCQPRPEIKSSCFPPTLPSNCFSDFLSTKP